MTLGPAIAAAKNATRDSQRRGLHHLCDPILDREGPLIEQAVEECMAPISAICSELEGAVGRLDE